MQYKTIILALLEKHLQLREELHKNQTLTTAIDNYVSELKDIHENWMVTLNEKRPGSDPAQISSEAMELALQDLENRLPSESPEEDEAVSAEEAMTFLRRHTPPA